MSGEWSPVWLPEGWSLEVFERTGSTNDVTRERGESGAAEGRVVVAEVQEAGRGRRGAAWVCPPGEGLAFSLLLRPRVDRGLWPRLSLAAGLAVAQALESFGMAAEVKWPNDVWIGGKKVAGILVEAGRDFVVVGIGINVGVSEFPEELAASATSLKLETGEAPSRAEVLSRVAERLARWSAKLDRGFDEVLRAFRERCALTGKRVSMQAADGSLSGEVVGIGEGGELLVRSGGEVKRVVQADEVRVWG